RHREPTGLARSERDDRRLGALADPLRDLGRLGGTCAREVNRELLAAIARGEVRLPDARREQVREDAQGLVAGWVAEAIVELLEVVEVEHQDRGLVGHAAGRQPALDALVEGAA